ncbi:MAG: NlpC/P60 family protein [Candidatus Taylorbacteria bacterium]|nr:NlpC/P60 family protein [Candidatus Taylorbacteria bacterium]
MEYRAVGCRCAVDIDSLRLPIPREEILSILVTKNFKVLEIDIVALARSYVGVSEYRRGARLAEAPAIFDCSSLIKWLYGQCGIWLPRRSIQQRELGESVGFSKISSGDVVFVSGRIDYYFDDPTHGVGHVGIATENNTVIHAGNRKIGVGETPLDKFVCKNKFRGARRYIPKDRKITILETPVGREVEIADDIRWIVLQSLPK